MRIGTARGFFFFFLLLSCLGSVTSGCGGFEPSTPLERAAARGDVAEIRALVAAGADPNTVGERGLPALAWAARTGETAAVEALLAGGADPNLKDRAVNGWTPLIHALHKHHTDTALALLEGGAGADVRCDGGTTALMYAAAYGNTRAVRALLARGADPRAEATGGVTALWNAAGGGALFDFTDGPALGTCYPETVEALLERAPDLKLERGLATRLVRALGSEECSRLLDRLERGG